jgi:hypothetical protein
MLTFPCNFILIFVKGLRCINLSMFLCSYYQLLPFEVHDLKTFPAAGTLFMGPPSCVRLTVLYLTSRLWAVRSVERAEEVSHCLSIMCGNVLTFTMACNVLLLSLISCGLFRLRSK